MHINWENEYKRIGDLKSGDCFFLQVEEEFYIKTFDGSCVRLSGGRVFELDNDIIVVPVEIKATAKVKTEKVPITPLTNKK